MNSLTTLKGIFPDKKKDSNRNFVLENIRSVNKKSTTDDTRKKSNSIRPHRHSEGSTTIARKHQASQTTISSALLNNDENLLINLLTKTTTEKAVQTEEKPFSETTGPVDENVKCLAQNIENNLHLTSENYRKETNENCHLPHQCVHLTKHHQHQHHQGTQMSNTHLIKDTCRPGWHLVPEDEKQSRLEMLQIELQNCINEMNRLPFFSTTLRARNQKIELERKMGAIENEIKLFSKSKVFVQL